MLLLTTTGRNSGAKRTTPLIYQRHGDDYLVVASNGGGDPPGWFLNLRDDPIVAVQVKADTHSVRARVATRAAQPDRDANVPVINRAGETFLYRYCLVGPCPAVPDGVPRWARVRTITTEVSLPNQATIF